MDKHITREILAIKDMALALDLSRDTINEHLARLKKDYQLQNPLTLNTQCLMLKSRGFPHDKDQQFNAGSHLQS